MSEIILKIINTQNNTQVALNFHILVDQMKIPYATEMPEKQTKEEKE